MSELVLDIVKIAAAGIFVALALVVWEFVVELVRGRADHE